MSDATLNLPTMMMQTTLAAMEVIVRRTTMIATGTCSTAEYVRMVDEKMTALSHTAATLARPGPTTAESLLAPWHEKATANAERLRSET